MRAIVLFFLISGMLTACGNSDSIDKNKDGSTKKLQIISSIKPIQAIVLAIAGEHGQSDQLIPDNASPHDYSFKPSDIRKIDKADVIFRIDEHMETQLNGVLKNTSANKPSIVSLAEVNGLILLESGHSHQQKERHDDKEEHSHDHDTYDEHEHGHQHINHDNVDFHIWTSPKNAILMANQVKKSLTMLDPKNTKQYQNNIDNFFEKVKTESEKIAVQLAPYKNKSYIVFHNSWQYFATEFGLQKPIVIDLHEGVSSGAKTISDIKDIIVKENINCVFYDSSIGSARLNVIAKNTKTVEIDVLAKNIDLDQTSYIRWLVKLGNQVESCLSD